ncbi:MAG: vanillate O-demethylase oxidoreductase VanB [Rhodanobacter sp. 68-29]|nr:SRPBCC family protein [Rhodanobacter sp.]ODU75881.1 MAG: vanillate O-demethylase oxidoreductase VanB [Rhodanobacter sp. SCN 69-32]OJY62097.1 MAG: vanillate O-demethylase oxidoreductase VanB [Rhodanobacter sp. 68-29]
MNTQPVADRIERQILLQAPRAKVWHALVDAESFGDWFGVNLEGQRFVAGQTARGHITYPGYEHLMCEMQIERIEPERLFSYRWHPYAVDPAADYSREPTTLVEFTLEDGAGGILLRLVESGFDDIPLARRTEAYRMNSGGWDEQVANIRNYLAGH